MRTAALRSLLFIELFRVALCDSLGENIYVSRKLTWSEAREYCRKHHTDLLSINSQEELDKLTESARGGYSSSASISSSDRIWTGLYKDVNDNWKWSDGGNVLFFLWVSLEETLHNQSCVMHSEKGLQAVSCGEQFPFYCFHSSLVLVKENKTWEEALEHCRSLDMDLVSLSSESVRTKVLQTSTTASTAHVWTGLRYLSDSWLWVDGTSTAYQAWSQEEIPQCPAWSHHCGALFREGQQLVSRDCAEKLNFFCFKKSTQNVKH
uniref:Novel immune-type receptor 3, related 1-like n=1 Tax=Fundulus heteroclitus TaxID=8078 RepID=A0A3Q2UJA8_FUNHE